MKLTINDYCIRCGLCIDLHADLFEFDYENDKIVKKNEIVPVELEEEAKMAIKECSIEAIKSED